MVGREDGNFGILLPVTNEGGCLALVKRLSNLIHTHAAFRSDQSFMSIAQALSFKSFTYPEKFLVPGPLKSVLEEIVREYPTR